MLNGSTDHYEMYHMPSPDEDARHRPIRVMGINSFDSGIASDEFRKHYGPRKSSFEFLF